jgi:transcriptional regulator with XRE-family HTH domain
MDDRRLGETVRRIRRESGLRQVDVAGTAGVSRSTVSDVERGLIETMDVGTVRAVIVAVGAHLVLDVRWRGADLARLMDRDHASIVERVVVLLRRSGWEVIVEWSFSHFGERGSVDVVAWHPSRRALLVVEVKSRIVDLQDLLSTLDRKSRLAPRILSAERGWRPDIVGRMVVAREAGPNRAVAATHAATLGSALPDRSRRCRRWILDPSGPLAGLWLLSDSAPGGVRSVPAGARRVRVRPRAGS